MEDVTQPLVPCSNGDSASSFVKRAAEPDVFHSNIGQPLQPCSNCFSTKSPTHSMKYVNVLDFAYYGGVSWPPFPGARMPFRWFADIRYTVSTPLPHSYPSITKSVLNSTRISSAVQEIAMETDTSLGRQRKRAVSFLNEMKASISKWICKGVAYILFKVFRRLMTQVLVCPAQMEQLKKAQETGIPLVYLPLHRSHLDYLLITWTVWHWGIQLPHIASGDNLNLSGFGWLLRGTGAFFIRRRIGDEKNTGCDQLYRSILNSYMTEVLRRGMPLEFFLEGTRSRFGKALLPKNGLISNVVEAVQKGEIPDVHLVPVSCTYERIAEDMFFEELMGKRKQRESVWGAVKGIVRSFGSGRCGAVRMHFGAPVLLSDYMQTLKTTLDYAREQFRLHSGEPEFSYRELLPWQRGTPNSTLIRAIGFHVVYDAQVQSSITICSAVSSLLLCKYSCGGHVESLTSDLVWLCDTLSLRGFDVIGWIRGKTDGEYAFQRALPLIENAISVHGDRFLVSPSHVGILRLAYYKNGLLPAFSITSAVALSVLSHRDSELASQVSLIETALIICDLLQFDVIFCKPCENLRGKIAKEVSDLSDHFLGLFRAEVGLESVSIKVDSEEAECTLQFFANIIKPFVYALYLTVEHLIALPRPFEGRDIDFIRDILAHPSDNNELFLTLQALNSDSVNNSLKLVREKHLLLEGSAIGLKNVENAHNLRSTLEHILSIN